MQEIQQILSDRGFEKAQVSAKDKRPLALLTDTSNATDIKLQSASIPGSSQAMRQRKFQKQLNKLPNDPFNHQVGAPRMTGELYLQQQILSKLARRQQMLDERGVFSKETNQLRCQTQCRVLNRKETSHGIDKSRLGGKAISKQTWSNGLHARLLKLDRYLTAENLQKFQTQRIGHEQTRKIPRQDGQKTKNTQQKDKSSKGSPSQTKEVKQSKAKREQNVWQQSNDQIVQRYRTRITEAQYRMLNQLGIDPEDCLNGSDIMEQFQILYGKLVSQEQTEKKIDHVQKQQQHQSVPDQNIVTQNQSALEQVKQLENQLKSLSLAENVYKNAPGQVQQQAHSSQITTKQSTGASPRQAQKSQPNIQPTNNIPRQQTQNSNQNQKVIGSVKQDARNNNSSQPISGKDSGIRPRQISKQEINRRLQIGSELGDQNKKSSPDQDDESIDLLLQTQETEVPFSGNSVPTAVQQSIILIRQFNSWLDFRMAKVLPGQYTAPRDADFKFFKPPAVLQTYQKEKIVYEKTQYTDQVQDQGKELLSRLEAVWTVLKMPVLDRLDMVMKYTSSIDAEVQIEQALAIWESVSNLVCLREMLLNAQQVLYEFIIQNKDIYSKSIGDKTYPTQDAQDTAQKSISATQTMNAFQTGRLAACKKPKMKIEVSDSEEIYQRVAEEAKEPLLCAAELALCFEIVHQILMHEKQILTDTCGDELLVEGKEYFEPDYCTASQMKEYLIDLVAICGPQ